MTIIDKKSRRKKVYVWPLVIARHETCYYRVCMQSGAIGTVPIPGSLICPGDTCGYCGSSVRYRYLGKQYFSMTARPSEFGRGLELGFVTGGFEDPAEAIIQLSKDLGLIAPQGNA
jgi:hypothetical protein